MIAVDESLVPLILVVGIYFGIIMTVTVCTVVHRCLGMELPRPYDEEMAPDGFLRRSWRGR